jgi:hypothetical protein
MPELQKSLQFGTTEPGKDKLRIETDITMSGTSEATMVQKTIVFANAFKSAPTIISAGVVLDNEAGVCNVNVTATQVEFTLAQVRTSGMTAAAKVCFAVVEGELL